MIAEDKVLGKVDYTSITTMLSVTKKIVTPNETTTLLMFQW